MRRIVCTGVATVDIVFKIDVPADRPIKYRASDSTIVSGGCALNAAAAVARLGGAAHLAAAVGDDPFGLQVKREMEADGVATDLTVTLDQVATARSAVLVDGAGERTIVNYRDPRLFAHALPLAEPFAYDGALVDTRWPDGARQVLRAARTAQKPAVVDAEAPIAPLVDALCLATHIAFSEQGLEDWAGAALATEGAQADALEAVARDTGAWVCVTRGALDVLCHDGNATSRVPAFQVDAVDTLGAGDVWHGAFALFLAEGLAERHAVRQANAVAAIKSATFGGRAALPDRAALTNFLAQHS